MNSEHLTDGTLETINNVRKRKLEFGEDLNKCQQLFDIPTTPDGKEEEEEEEEEEDEEFDLQFIREFGLMNYIPNLNSTDEIREEITRTMTALNLVSHNCGEQDEQFDKNEEIERSLKAYLWTLNQQLENITTVKEYATHIAKSYPDFFQKRSKFE